MLTIFAVPKPFVGHIGLIQRNALASWTRLDGCEVLLCGDEPGVADAARQFNVRHLPRVDRNDYGTPLLHSVFTQARQAATRPLLCYINADIILLNDFLSAVGRIHLSPFLAVGQRWDLDLAEPLSFGPAWSESLRARVLREGRPHPPSGSDYFVFPAASPLDLPLPFAVGRPAWDNWFIYAARRQSVPVVDMTEAVLVVHQNHDYHHVPGRVGGFWEGPEANANRSLIGSWDRVFTLADSTHRLTAAGLRPAWHWPYLVRRWQTLAEFYPALLPVWRLGGRLRDAGRSFQGWARRRTGRT